jgi:aminopeptidase N
MLRGQLGDQLFRAGIREYYRRHAHGTALTEELKAAFEAVSGRDLNVFFEQWVYERGYPVFRTSHGWDARRREAILVITQVQNVDWTRFQMPLEVELFWEGGSRRERLQITNAREVFTFSTPGPLTRVDLDPDRWLLYAREGGGR